MTATSTRSSVRREFFLPEFFRSPAEIARSGISNPVADIAFPKLGSQNVMLVAERGGVRNLGLSAGNAFAYPDEARVLRYEIDAGGKWQPAGRYDVGFYDRKNEGPPYVRAGAAGGAAFGMGYDASGQIDPTKADAFVWMTGDGLCAPDGPCFDPATGTYSDVSEVTGLQGQDGSASEEVIPDAAFQPYPAPGPAYPAAGPSQSYMIDADIDVDGSGTPIPEELARNDATRVGDIVVLQQAQAPEKPDLRIAKRALDGACLPGENCRFEVTITNVGEVPYSGPLTVHDTVGNGSVLVVPPSPDWVCEQQFASIYDCSHGPVDLAPGAGISFRVTFQVPTWWARPVFDNCVELRTPGAGEDARTYNNNACGYAASVEPGTQYYVPDLQLSKFGLSGQCDWADNCLFVIRVTNVGAAPYFGPLAIHDRIHFPGATLAAWAPDPEWTCAPAGVADFGCTHAPVNLAPGEFREITLRIVAPPPTPGHTHVRNCGRFDWGGAPGDYNPGNEYDCATISRFPPGFPGATAMLDVEKFAAPTCSAGAGPGGGWLCHYGVLVSNVGGAPYFGPIEVHDVTIGPAATLAVVDPAPWACAPGVGALGAQTCTHPGAPAGLPPAGTTLLSLSFEVPAAVVSTGLWNCGTVASDHDGDGFAEDHTSCAISLVCEAGSAACPKDLAILKRVQFTRPVFAGFSVPVRCHGVEHRRRPLSRSGQNNRHARPGGGPAFPDLGNARTGMRRPHVQLSGRYSAGRLSRLIDGIHDPAGLRSDVVQELRQRPAGSGGEHRAGQRQVLCYCPSAVRGSVAVRQHGVQARRELHSPARHQERRAAALRRQHRRARHAVAGRADRQHHASDARRDLLRHG